MRIVLEFPTTLLKSVDDAAGRIGTDRDGLIRSAVRCFLDELEAKEFERELAAGYAANADLSRAIAAEFAGNKRSA